MWNKAGTKANLKNNRSAIRMVHAEVISSFQDNTISTDGHLQYDYHWKQMCMVVNETHIYDVTMNFFHY